MSTSVLLRGLSVALVGALALETISGCSTEPSCSESRTCTPAEPVTGGTGGGALGESSGGAGLGGSMGPATGGSGGSPAAEAGAVGEGGEGGEGKSPAMPSDSLLGQPCSKEGSLTCAEAASSSILICEGELWKLSEECARGTLCDSAEPQCAALAPGCERLAPGGAFCEGATRFVCGPDLVTLEEEECAGRCSGGKCADASCGDAVVQDGEACDDGNDVDTDECTSICEKASCGDGFLFARQETCDDGNDIDTDDCPSTCEEASCGDGFVLEGVEECDDANPNNLDACLSNCKAARCGDGVIQSGKEECDDSNSVNTDACPSTCKSARCGDDFVWADNEECDDGRTLVGDGCDNECQAEPYALALGYDHTCVILFDGRLKCWGDNTHGQVGPLADLIVGDTESELGPNLDTVLDGVSSVGGGWLHTCANQGWTVSCWGNNQYGQIGGPATLASSRAPLTIDLPDGAVSNCVSNRTSYALLRDATVSMWGAHYDNSEGGIQTVPFSERVESIGCGTETVCAVLESGNVECWGTSEFTAAHPDPMRIDVGDRAGSRVVQVVHGGSHACVRHENGELRCWGNNIFGQLGEGHTDSRVGDLAANEDWEALDIGGVVRVLSAGRDVTCAALVDGSAKCWGSSALGVLGLPPPASSVPAVGDDADEHVGSIPPIDLGTGEKVRSIATSGLHSCAVLSSGRMKCWGSNRSGELGLGTTDEAVGDGSAEMGDYLNYVDVD